MRTGGRESPPASHTVAVVVAAAAAAAAAGDECILFFSLLPCGKVAFSFWEGRGGGGGFICLPSSDVLPSSLLPSPRCHYYHRQMLGNRVLCVCVCVCGLLFFFMCGWMVVRGGGDIHFHTTTSAGSTSGLKHTVEIG